MQLGAARLPAWRWSTDALKPHRGRRRAGRSNGRLRWRSAPRRAATVQPGRSEGRQGGETRLIRQGAGGRVAPKRSQRSQQRGPAKGPRPPQNTKPSLQSCCRSPCTAGVVHTGQFGTGLTWIRSRRSGFAEAFGRGSRRPAQQRPRERTSKAPGRGPGVHAWQRFETTTDARRKKSTPRCFN